MAVREWRRVTFTEELDRALGRGAAIMDPESEEILICHGRSWRSASTPDVPVMVRPARQLVGREVLILREGGCG